MNTTRAEENYLKAIFRLSKNGEKKITPSLISGIVYVSQASVVNMIKRLVQKKYITYSRKEGAHLSDRGEKVAISIIRSHRLWEVFLVDKLGYSWGEIHVIAEQLEHIKDGVLVEKLEKFLGYPAIDPHGDPIPDIEGSYTSIVKKTLSQLPVGSECSVASVSDENADFLNFLEKLCINIGSRIKVLEKNSFDSSLLIRVEQEQPIFVTQKFADNLFVM